MKPKPLWKADETAALLDRAVKALEPVSGPLRVDITRSWPGTQRFWFVSAWRSWNLGNGINQVDQIATAHGATLRAALRRLLAALGLKS